MTRLLMSLVLLSGLALGTTGCKKNTVLAKSTLDVNKPLVISFDGDLAPCDEHICVVALAEKVELIDKTLELTGGARVVRVKGDGSWTILEAGDAADAEDESEDEADEEEEEGLPENWKDEPLTTYEDRKAEADEKYMGNFTKELASGTLAEAEGVRLLEIAPELLPVGKFSLFTNGHFGATYDGTPIGSPRMTGLIELAR